MSQELKDDLFHIRKMMEQSSRFISLSGLSGVIIGIIALIGAALAYFGYNLRSINDNIELSEPDNSRLLISLVGLAAIVLVAAVSISILFAVRKSKSRGLQIWTATTRQLLISLAVPLIAGGFFCIAFIYHGYFTMIAPATLVFYGLALVGAAKYTYSDIQNLGYCEILLGSITLLLPEYGLGFWAAGFGLLHIIYGLVMYRKYEKSDDLI